MEHDGYWFFRVKRLIYLIFVVLSIEVSSAKDISVNTSEQLVRAFHYASPGTRILLLPGSYNVYRLDTFVGGTAQQPIVVEANSPDAVLVKATGSEAICIHHPFWTFKNLTIKGNAHSEHAFHVTDDADNVILKNNRLIDFNAQIKVNGENHNFPDNGLIEDNDIFNTGIRRTDSPVTSIDIVGGKNWVVRGNYVADFSKELSDKTSYGIFMKGNSANGLIERNLVICSKDTTGGIRIGMSFGGGGTGYEYCENMDCNVEHSDGLMRNNVVLNCSDVGVYINKAKDSVIEHNTLLMTVGIDVRYPQSSAIIKNNILTGSVRTRDGGKFDVESNVILGSKLGMWFPTISGKIKHRISDYDIKFPNFISRENVEKVQDFVDKIFSFLEKTRLGLGQNKTQDCFPGLVMGNIRPDRNECGIFWESNESSSDNMEDFWGNKRSLTRNFTVMGAIDFYTSTCDMLNRIQHKPVKSLSRCLN